jgi:hypothetical protein
MISNYIFTDSWADHPEEELLLDENEEPMDPDEIITEIKFVPEEAEILPSLYNAIQECTLLHPDSASDMSGKLSNHCSYSCHILFNILSLSYNI